MSSISRRCVNLCILILCQIRLHNGSYAVLYTVLNYVNQRKRCKTTPETKTYFRGMAAKALVIGICVTLFPKEDEVYFCHFSVDILFCCLPHSIAETTKLFPEMYKLSPCTNKTVLVDSIVTKIKVFIVKKKLSPLSSDRSAWPNGLYNCLLGMYERGTAVPKLFDALLNVVLPHLMRKEVRKEG